MDNVGTDNTYFLATLWQVWRSRNRAVFDQHESNSWEIIYASVSLSTVIRSAFNLNSDSVPKVTHFISWEAPLDNRIAINIDGSVIEGKRGLWGTS
ncbi:LINE-1 reverse transcriptase isogeny [Sesbania bispinosa]|nr:LINE-1 reverse transcriptase isogeny [Sesbania bispinosa]